MCVGYCAHFDECVYHFSASIYTYNFFNSYRSNCREFHTFTIIIGHSTGDYFSNVLVLKTKQSLFFVDFVGRSMWTDLIISIANVQQSTKLFSPVQKTNQCYQLFYKIKFSYRFVYRFCHCHCHSTFCTFQIQFSDSMSSNDFRLLSFTLLTYTYKEIYIIIHNNVFFCLFIYITVFYG